MRHALRFILPLFIVLGLLAWGASAVMNGISRGWFERDVDLRAQLAVHGAREALASHMRSGDRARVERLLISITRDERILASAACGTDLTLVAASPWPRLALCGA